MEAVVTSVSPIFGILLLGYLAARLGGFDEAANRGLSLFIFNFAIPPLLFRSMALADLPDSPPWGLLLSYYPPAFIAFASGMIFSRQLFGRSAAEMPIAGFSAAFSNTIFLGIPLALTAFGERAALPLFLLIAFHSLLLMPTVTIALEIGRGRARGLWRIPLATLRGLATNPVIIGLLLGLGWNLLQLPLPEPLDRATELLGQAATPGALFALGAALTRYSLAGNLGEPAVMVGLKMLLHPLLVWLLAGFVFDLPPLWTAVLVLIAALPTGVNAYLFAQRYEVNIPTATTTIFLSTLVGLASLPLVLYLLGQPQ